jgi:hypothetical protein
MKDQLKKFSVVFTVMAFLFSSAAFADKRKSHEPAFDPGKIPVKPMQLKSEPHPSAKGKNLKRL